MALGIALSVKAELGVSPISSVPYVYSLRFSLSLGEFMILMNISLIILQILLLRKNYKLFQLVQLPAGIAMGYALDLAMYMVRNLNIGFYGMQLFWCITGCLILAIGVFLEVQSDLTVLPGEGFAMALSETFHIEFGKAKVLVDSSMVLIGAVSSLIFMHQILGIREGTVISALSVGFIVRFLTGKITGYKYEKNRDF